MISRLGQTRLQPTADSHSHDYLFDGKHF